MTARESREHITKIVFALSAAHGEALRRVITSTDGGQYERAQKDASDLLEAMMRLTSIEMYLYNQERMEAGDAAK